MKPAVLAVLAGLLLFLAGLFLLLTLLCGWAYGLAAVLIVSGLFLAVLGMVTDVPDDH